MILMTRVGGGQRFEEESDHLEVEYLRHKSYLKVLFGKPGVPIENKPVTGGGLL